LAGWLVDGFIDRSKRKSAHRADPLPKRRSATTNAKTKQKKQGSTFSVMLDPKGNGNWYSCTTIDLSESGLEPVSDQVTE
jgi:hypothetical protein